LIIGVLVGLGAALAVAVYVTRVPVPFLSKGQSRTAEQDAAESLKNKDWDPNAPLYGKNPAKPAASAAAAAASEPASAVAAAPAISPASSPASSPAGGPPARADAKPAATSADPLGDLARAKTAAPAAAPAIGAAPSTLEPFVYFVQVGAFRSADEAEALRARLSLSGVETRVTEREQSGRMVHRVRVGPFERREEAERAKDKLDTTGLETALVRVQR
jgi:cell division protein FtsN